VRARVSPVTAPAASLPGSGRNAALAETFLHNRRRPRFRQWMPIHYSLGRLSHPPVPDQRSALIHG